MIRYADGRDFDLLRRYDRHIGADALKSAIDGERILIIEEGVFAGWLRYNYFWDSLPFMNMLYLLEEYRGKGYGTELVNFWEAAMREKGYDMVLTSTQSDERGQFFYRKNGYVDCGSLLLPGEPLEIILLKRIRESARRVEGEKACG